MATYIKTLKEDNGDITYPQTKAGAVLLNNGSDLETELSQYVTAEEIGSTAAVDYSKILSKIYPVGSIYMSATLSTTAQVNAALGGTWEAWGAGKVPVGVNKSETEFNTVEKTGGEKTHKLTIKEMPSHTHAQDPHGHRARYAANMGGGGYHGPNSSGNLKDWNTWIENTTATNQKTGGDGAHNNLQPYITCYMYKRIS